MKSFDEIQNEVKRIIDFISNYVCEGDKVVVPVSGGLDSDVVARLCVMALGNKRVRLFFVNQHNTEHKYLINVKNLSNDIGVPLAIIEIGSLNQVLIEILQQADPEVGFNPQSLLDPARANCSLRTAIISSYQDKGYLVAANSNRSEIELGFFMPFGDNLGHFKPISHLYKSEVKVLAEIIGSRKEVIDQLSSAGFWEGENDLEDIAYWIYNGGPIAGSTQFTEDDDENVQKIRVQLSQEKIDNCLIMFHTAASSQEIADEVGLPYAIVDALKNTVDTSYKLKRRVLMESLER